MLPTGCQRTAWKSQHRARRLTQGEKRTYDHTRMSSDINSSACETPADGVSARLPRERIKQLAECLLAGRTRKHIAEALDVSVRTVDRLKKDPTVLAEVDRLRSRTDEELVVDSLKHLLSSDNERVVLGAAQTLLRLKNQGIQGESKPESAPNQVWPEEEEQPDEEMALMQEAEQWHEAFSGAVYAGEVLTLRVEAFPEEIRGTIQDFLAAEPDAANAQWAASKEFAPMTWRRDGKPYSPTGLVNKIRVAAGLETVTPVEGVADYWVLPNGVTASEQPKFVSRYELTPSQARMSRPTHLR